MGKTTIRHFSRLLCAVLLALFAAGTPASTDPKPVKLTTTADHTKFKELQREFASGPDVTKACLSCHTEAAG